MLLRCLINKRKHMYIIRNKKELEFIVFHCQSDADLNNLNVVNITGMSYLFHQINFNGQIDKWDVSNVVDMSYMFSNSVFNQDISGWNMENVEVMDWMFFASKFNQNINNWKVKTGKTYRMFDSSPLEVNPPVWYEDDFKYR